MKVPFWMYFLWRCLKFPIIAVTSPLWAPIVVLAAMLITGHEVFAGWYETIEDDWERKYGEQNEDR